MRLKLLLLTLALGLLVFATTANAQMHVSHFTSVAKGSCTPLPSCSIPQRGFISCPGGGDASVSLMPPWCTDGRTKVRDRMLVYRVMQSTDERVLGNVTFRLNMNLDTATFSGQIWGTYLIEVPGRGTWEGTWEGKAHSATHWTYKVVMFGSGEFEGLKIKANGDWQPGQGDVLVGQIKNAEDKE